MYWVEWETLGRRAEDRQYHVRSSRVSSQENRKAGESKLASTTTTKGMKI